MHDVFRNKEYDALVIENLIALADHESIKLSIDAEKSQIERNKKSKEDKDIKKNSAQERYEALNEDFAILSSDRLSNQFGIIAEKARQRIIQLNQDKNREESNCAKLEDALSNVNNYYQTIVDNDEQPFDSSIIETLSLPISIDKKHDSLKILEDYENEQGGLWSEKFYSANSRYEQEKSHLQELREKKKNLELHKFAYPKQAVKLKETIEEEFKTRGLNSRAYFLCDLLDLTDDSWRDAVEGILGDYRFFVMVEPKVLNIALETFQRIKTHSYGIIDCQALVKNNPLAMSNTLASFVTSKDDVANQFISSFLGQFVCCSDLKDFDGQSNAITQSCEVYRDSSYSKIDPAVYSNPYIGMGAFEIQIQNVSNEIEVVESRMNDLRDEKNKWKSISDARLSVNLQAIEDYMAAPKAKADIVAEIAEKTKEEREARKNPDLIMLEQKISEIAQQKEKQKEIVNHLSNDINDLSSKIQTAENQLSSLESSLEQKRLDCESRSSQNIAAYNDAEKKFKENRTQKDPAKIIENYRPRLKSLEGDKSDALDKLKESQTSYNLQFMCDLRLGTIDMQRYSDIWRKLDTVDIVERKNRLDQKKSECEDIFKNEFVFKMGESIRDAYSQFKKLNEKLRTLQYGEDTYEFKISYGKGKETLCTMFMDDNNLGGGTFLSLDFNERYKNELADLYDKVIASDDENSKIVKEYSDYRTYLDFDIIIRKTEGRILKYSKVIGEKSGSETQVPFYVAIAASFFVLYDNYPSVRLILFDEAFEKMDDYRIVTTMQFYQKLGLQTILVTPPAKIDTIQSEVNSVIVASRENDRSFVVEYSHAK